MTQESKALEQKPDGVQLIARERRRHFDVEGWTDRHDDEHDKGELANAAACYALSPNGGDAGTFCRKWWPFEWSWFKPSKGPYPKERIKELAKSGALIAAEIDRLIRKYPDVLSEIETPQKVCNPLNLK